MAAIPKIDPYDSDAELFNSYSFIIGLTMVVMMGIFIIMSATVASKVIVDEYRDKKAMLLFLYPISRKKIMGAKMFKVDYAYLSSRHYDKIMVIVLAMYEASLLLRFPSYLFIPGLQQPLLRADRHIVHELKTFQKLCLKLPFYRLLPDKGAHFFEFPVVLSKLFCQI